MGDVFFLMQSRDVTLVAVSALNCPDLITLEKKVLNCLLELLKSLKCGSIHNAAGEEVPGF